MSSVEKFCKISDRKSQCFDLSKVIFKSEQKIKISVNILQMVWK